MDAICSIESSSSSSDNEDDNVSSSNGGVILSKSSKSSIGSNNTRQKVVNKKEESDDNDDIVSDNNDDGQNYGSSNRPHKRPRTENSQQKKCGSIRIVQERKTSKTRKMNSVATSTSKSSSSIFSRSVPHRRGHWSGHVKIPLLVANKTVSPKSQRSHQSTTLKYDSDSTSTDSDDNDDDETFRTLLRKRCRSSTRQFQQWLVEQRHSQGYSSSDSVIMEHDYHHLHISLSKYFFISLANIDPFVAQLQQLIQDTKLVPTRLYLCTTSSTTVSMDEMKFNAQSPQPTTPRTILVNDERTRSFWCWNVLDSGNSKQMLIQLINLVDTVLQRYNQPTYYQPPSFHVSVASYPGDVMNMSCSSSSSSSSKRTTIDHDGTDDGADDDDDDENVTIQSAGGPTTTTTGNIQQSANQSDNKHKVIQSSSSTVKPSSTKDDEDNDADATTVHGESDTDDDGDDDESNIISFVVDRIVCTFGTTKEYTIPLRS